MAAPPHPPQPGGPPDFDGWVAARAPALLRFAYVLTGQPGEADDLVQHALAVAHSRWRRLAGVDALEPRLRSVMVRTHLRRTGRRRTHAPEDAGAGEPLWAQGPGGAADPDEAARLVWDRCRALPPRARAALVLRCYDGLDVAEIAAVMGARRATARMALREGLDQAVPGRHEREERVTAVRRALEQYAELAPDPCAPADRAVVASRRLRHRRRRTGAALAAALVVPAAWALAAGGGPSPPAPPRSVPASDASPVDFSGWRYESWGGIQVQVPGSWGHGDLTQWCVPGGPSGPAVDRPGLDSTHALCSLHDDGRPTYTGGLLLRRTEDAVRLSRADVAPYATTRIHTVGDVTLTVVDIDPAVGSAILASAEVIGRRDFNGCEPRRERRRPSLGATRAPAGPLNRIASVESVSVCRYALGEWPRPTLVSSRRLTGERAHGVLAALRAAPVQPLSAAPGPCRGAARELAVLELWQRHAAGPDSFVVRYDGCRGLGVDDGLSTRGLTAGVLEPVLVPPWNGQISVRPTGSAD